MILLLSPAEKCFCRSFCLMVCGVKLRLRNLLAVHRDARREASRKIMHLLNDRGRPKISESELASIGIYNARP